MTNQDLIEMGFKEIPTFTIQGSVEIIDCVINHESIWAEKCDPVFKYGTDKVIEATYNWVLANPILFDNPISNVKGRLLFWDYPMPDKI